MTTPEPTATAAVTSLRPDEAVFLDIIGDLIEQWGFNRHTGRIWALLYLRSEPLTPRQIQQALNLSAGSVNSLLSELLTWGAVRRMRVPGDRNYYFEPQMSVWKSVATVLRSRELRILAEAKANLERLLEALRKQPKGARRDLQIERLEKIDSLMATGASIGNLLVNAPVEKLERLAGYIRRLRNL